MEGEKVIAFIIIGIFVGAILSSCGNDTYVNMQPEEVVSSLEEIKDSISELSNEIDILHSYVDEDKYCTSLLKSIRFVTDDNKIHYYDCDVVVYRKESGEHFKIYAEEELSNHPEYTICNECSWYRIEE